MTGDRKDLEHKWIRLSFGCCLNCCCIESTYLDFDTVKTNFVLLTNNKEDKEHMEERNL